MFDTADIGAACAVDRATVRSWLSRAPGFTIGSMENGARYFTYEESLALVIAGELIARGLGVPSEILPVTSRIAGGATNRTVWVFRDRHGELTFADQQPSEVAVALPLPTLAARLHRVPSGQRIGRTTR